MSVQPRLHWQIRDAATGLLDEGHLEIADLERLQPWPAVRERSRAPQP